ncbi:MAG: glycosyltransferase [Candidatus Electryonea clarkiae]|nr:glycosyltransferase [Candidatus Electryonea clarkiae]MDP8287501.1 glycosyltransferase [Candidatus Electryonea clarkiae]
MTENKRITVLHIITRLDPGGSAENTVLSVERVDPSRFDSTILTGPGLKGSGPPSQYTDRIGHKLKVDNKLVRPVRPFTDLAGLFSLAKYIKNVQPQIIHLHSAKSGAIGRVAAKLARSKAKVIYTPHGHVFSGYGGSLSNKVFTIIEKYLVKWTDAIVGLTLDEIRIFQEVGAGHQHLFCVIPSGVELHKYYQEENSRAEARKKLGLADDTLVVGFIGRFDEVKGPDRFIEVAKIVSNTLTNVRFVIAGDGEMRAELEKRAVELGISDAILWLGWQPDTPALYPAFDVLALTSRNEGQGRVLVEAMAAEIPQVAMDSGGVAEVIVNEKTGYVMPNGDIDSTANAIIDLLNDEELR